MIHQYHRLHLHLLRLIPGAMQIIFLQLRHTAHFQFAQFSRKRE